MTQKESFYRGEALGSFQFQLPANTYNLTRTLLHQSDGACVFVPIRSMQFMSVIDHEEVIFIYMHRRTMIEFSWRHFKPNTRESLKDPVPYELVYYDKQALETMQRIQGEFHKYAHQLYEKNQKDMLLNQTNKEKVTPFISDRKQTDS